MLFPISPPRLGTEKLSGIAYSYTRNRRKTDTYTARDLPTNH